MKGNAYGQQAERGDREDSGQEDKLVRNRPNYHVPLEAATALCWHVAGDRREVLEVDSSAG